MSATFTEVDAAEVARRLRTAEFRGEPIPPLVAAYPELTVEDAYRIQLENVKSRTQRGVCITGHKVGLTSQAMQEMLGVDEPDYGHIFDEITLADGDTLDCARLIAPRAEPEIAFVLADDLPGHGSVTSEQVLDATAYVCPALEIIDSRIADWKIGLVDTVADNASCARVVLGTQQTPVTDVALALVTATITVGEAVEHGSGAAVLGHPAKAVAWLANAVAEYGTTLKAGHVVLPGAMTKALDIAAGDHVHADFGDLGTVEVFCA